MTTKEMALLQRNFGEHIQQIRESKNLSILQLSYSCSLEERVIATIEHGKFNITLATIMELARGLGVPAKNLLDFDFEFEE